MKVILRNNFIQFQINDYDIYALGINPELLSEHVDNIQGLVDQLKSISNQYAVVITKCNHLYFACVDHLASIPLYYTNEFITDNWFYVDSNKSNFKTDWKTLIEAFLLAGQNIGTNTQFNEVTRLLPGRYLFRDKQIVYKSLNSFPVFKKDLKETIIEKFKLAEKDNNVLMFSGGTDSVFLLHLVMKYARKNWRIIHMYSDREINNEYHIVKEVEKWYRCNIETYNLDNINEYSLDNTIINDQHSRTTFQNYWHHEEMLPKIILLNMAKVSNNDLVWTGEVGDQLFGGPKMSSLLSTYIQQNTVESIANLWIDLSASYNSNFMTDFSKSSFYSSKFNHPQKGPHWKIAYEKLVKEISSAFYESSVNDLSLRFIHMNYLIKGPFRIWPYSQLYEYKFYHIFAEYDLACLAFNMSSTDIVPNGVLKGCLLNLFKEELPAYVWELPKSGPTMPTDRLRQRFIG